MNSITPDRRVDREPNLLHHGRRVLYRFWQAIGLVSATILATPSTGHAQTAAPPTHLSVAVIGSTSHYKKKAEQSYKLVAQLFPMSDPGHPGGAAAFGLMDDDRVVLLAHAKYLPSLSPALLNREVETAKPPLDLPEMPRFVMMCTWPLVGDRPGTPLLAYAERDDANRTITKHPKAILISVYWRTIPATRAPKALVSPSLCNSMASGDERTQPLWLRTRNL